jgi:hypothetical protein
MRGTSSILVAALAVAGCTTNLDPTGGDDDGSGSGSGDPPVCETTRSYTGFGGDKLEADRPAIEAGSDRMRLKPFVALAAEYAAALGLATFDTSAFAATFGKPPARWYSEPAASANTVYAAFALAYDACTQHVASDAAYAMTPSAQLADTFCRDHARAAWHREATDAEVAACTTYAVDQTKASDPPRKRWAYTCAAVLSASGFLAY